MSTVIFKRTDDQNTVPIVDGQLVFDETNYKIYMDNGNTRYQYGGDTDIISNPASATATNVFSATASANLFLQKTTVVDTKSNALAVTQNYIPLGCLAFKETIGTTNYSGVGSTISEGLVSLKSTSNLHTNQLSANSNNIYMDYHDGKYGINTSANRGADTFIPFKPSVASKAQWLTVNGGDVREASASYTLAQMGIPSSAEVVAVAIGYSKVTINWESASGYQATGECTVGYGNGIITLTAKTDSDMKMRSANALVYVYYYE
jgi:hypothetical protein